MSKSQESALIIAVTTSMILKDIARPDNLRYFMAGGTGGGTILSIGSTVLK